MKIYLNLKSTNKLSLFCYTAFLKKILFKCCIDNKNVCFSTKIKKITLLKSSHVNKKAKESFESRYYTCIFIIKNCKTLKLLKFILFNKPQGVQLKMKIVGGE
jgi:ribosomal protein S10